MEKAYEYISVMEAATITGYTVNIIQDRARKNKIEGAKKLSGVWLIPKEWAILNKKKPSISELAKANGVTRVTTYKRLKKETRKMGDKTSVAYTFGRIYAVVERMTDGDKAITKHYDEYMRTPGKILPEILRVVNSKRRAESLEVLLTELISTITPEDMKLEFDLEHQSALIIGVYHEKGKMEKIN